VPRPKSNRGPSKSKSDQLLILLIYKTSLIL